MLPFFAVSVYFFIPNSLFLGGAEAVCFILLLFVGIATSGRIKHFQSEESYFLFVISLVFTAFLISAFISNLLNAFDMFLDRFTITILVKMFSFTCFALIIIKYIDSKEDLIRILKWFSLVGFFATSVIGLFQFFCGKRILYSSAYSTFYGDRPFSRLTTFKMDDPNCAMVDLLPLTLILFFFGFIFSEKKSLIWKLLFFISTLSLVLTFSRTGYCIFAISLFLIILMSELPVKRKINYLLVLGFLIVFLSMLLVFRWFSDGHSFAFFDRDRFSSAYNLHVRIDFWRTTLAVLFENPYNIFFGLAGKDIKLILYEAFHVMSSNHSFYFTVLFKYGFFGVFASLAYLISVFQSFRRAFFLSRFDVDVKNLILILFFCFGGYLILITTISDVFDFYMFFIPCLVLRTNFVCSKYLRKE